MRINPTTSDPAVSIREKTNLGRIAQIIGPHGGGEWRATIGSFRERKQRPWVLLMLNFVDSAKKVFGAKKENTVSSDGGVIVEAAPVKENDLHWALGKAWEDRVQLAEARLDLRRDASEFLMANLYRVVHSELQGLGSMEVGVVMEEEVVIQRWEVKDVRDDGGGCGYFSKGVVEVIVDTTMEMEDVVEMVVDAIVVVMEKEVVDTEMKNVRGGYGGGACGYSERRRNASWWTRVNKREGGGSVTR
ncbi:unnamed protein product [Brassica napus]|uniref:(rape) hypothetical protein n=1 Tax=Brassica napus TaxID=3708 RepID=A0A816JLW5_BRANA|nr:unnamed protein product [Brassica napus]